MAAKPKESPELRARRLADVHRAAQERLGLTAAIEVLAVYEEVFNPSQANGTARVKPRLRTAVTSLRALSRRLAGHYFALSRAMQTGYTVSDIEGHRDTGQPHMSDLYTDMATVLNEVVSVTTKRPKGTTPATQSDAPTDTSGPSTGPSESPPTTAGKEQRIDDLVDEILSAFTDLVPDHNSDDWTERVERELFEWPPDDVEAVDLLDQLVEQERKQFEAERRKILRDKKLSHERALQKLQDAADRQAAQVAMKAMKTTIDSSRDVIEQSAIKDRRTVAWMRVTGANPCAWCAMLASRGAAYHTETSAGGNGNLYHENCACTPFPVYTTTPAYSDRDLFFINNWGPVTKGLDRKESLITWRRWLADQKRAGRVPGQASFGKSRAA